MESILIASVGILVGILATLMMVSIAVVVIGEKLTKGEPVKIDLIGVGAKVDKDGNCQFYRF